MGGNGGKTKVKWRKNGKKLKKIEIMVDGMGEVVYNFPAFTPYGAMIESMLL